MPKPDSKFAMTREGAVPSLEFNVDSARRLVVLKLGKKVKARDLERYAKLLRANPSFDPGFSEIADLRELEKFDVEANEMVRLADQIDPFSHHAYRAFVVRTTTQAHAARMHKILRTQRNFEIFRSLQEAEQWISKQVSHPSPTSSRSI